MSRLLIIAFLVLAACSEEEAPPPPPMDPQTVEVHYDAENVTAPFLVAQRYEGGAYFPQERMAEHDGQDLLRVSFFLKSLPAACEVKIYEEGPGEAPGGLLYRADVTQEMTAASWNLHELDPPLSLDGSGIWVVVSFTNPQTQATLGCDPGPAVPNGDWLYDASDAMWLPIRTRLPAVNINWNVRAHVTKPDSTHGATGSEPR